MPKNRFLHKAVSSYIFDPSGDATQRALDSTFVLDGPALPDNAIIIDAWVDVITTFTSATDACTIALSTGQGAGDLVAALAISHANPGRWDASTTAVKGTLVTAPNLGADAAHDTALEVIDLVSALKIKMSANRQPTAATAATEVLTAGKLILYIEYILSIE